MPSTIPLVKSGTATITGAGVSSAITFTTSMLDANYSIELTPQTPTGLARGFESPWVTAKLLTGFTININTAPGGADTVLINWIATEHINL
jgi:hypothetical protein